MTRSDRIHLRINPELKKLAQEYCERKHVTLSDLVTRCLVELLEAEANQADAEQA